MWLRTFANLRNVVLALTDGLIDPKTPLFDYGCGRGDDLRILSVMDYSGSGWDPVHRPDATMQPAPVVNLGYVVNVIEKPAERQYTLRRAWELTERVLIVSARLSAEAPLMSEAEALPTATSPPGAHSRNYSTSTNSKHGLTNPSKRPRSQPVRACFIRFATRMNAPPS
jgi:hypothetical protein